MLSSLGSLGSPASILGGTSRWPWKETRPVSSQGNKGHHLGVDEGTVPVFAVLRRNPRKTIFWFGGRPPKKGTPTSVFEWVTRKGMQSGRDLFPPPAWA